MKTTFLNSSIKQFEYYKTLGDKTFEQLNNKEIHWNYNSTSNSPAIIVKHIVGNMLSRWTNFLSEDGEKSWRNRDDEFIDTYNTKEELLTTWNNGWSCLFNTLQNLKEEDLEKIVYIRNQGHTVTEAINRQLAHYSYHIGQLVYLGTMIKGKDWNSLSIPKGKSETYNKDKFSKAKGIRHFTEDL